MKRKGENQMPPKLPWWAWIPQSIISILAIIFTILSMRG